MLRAGRLGGHVRPTRPLVLVAFIVWCVFVYATGTPKRRNVSDGVNVYREEADSAPSLAIVTDTGCWYAPEMVLALPHQRSHLKAHCYTSDSLFEMVFPLDRRSFSTNDRFTFVTLGENGKQKFDSSDHHRGNLSFFPSWLDSYHYWVRVPYMSRVRHCLRRTIKKSLNDYSNLLRDFPVLTKSITSFLVSGSGDILAQTGIERRFGEKTRDITLHKVDLHRTLTVAGEGMFVSGPILHYAYTWMDEYFTIDTADTDGEPSTLRIFLLTIYELIFEIVLLDSFFVFTLMVTSAILQGRWRDIHVELKNEYFPAVKVSFLSSLSMTPIQFINFRYVPVHFRVLVTNFEDCLWNAAVSYMAHRSRK